MCECYGNPLARVTQALGLSSLLVNTALAKKTFMVNPPNFQSLQDYIKKKSIFFPKDFHKID